MNDYVAVALIIGGGVTIAASFLAGSFMLYQHWSRSEENSAWWRQAGRIYRRNRRRRIAAGRALARYMRENRG